MIRASKERYSPDVLSKAASFVRGGRVERDRDYEHVWWVLSGGMRYRVQLGLDEEDRVRYITCTCPHGVNVGAGDTRCSHSAAVLMVLDQEQQTQGEGGEQEEEGEVIEVDFRKATDLGELEKSKARHPSTGAYEREGNDE